MRSKLPWLIKKNDKNDKLIEFVNSVLRKKPELKPKIDELCDRYKIKF